LDPARIPDGQQSRFATPVSAALAQQRGKFKDEAAPPLSMPAPGQGRVRFRSKVGRRQVIIPLFRPHVHRDNPEWDTYYKGYRRWLMREEKRGRITKEMYEPKDKLLHMEIAVMEVIGKYFLRMVPVAGRQECVLETSEPAIADYMRWRISRGDFPYVYEETRNFELVVNGQVIQLKPNSLADQAVLANYFASLQKGEDASVEVAGSMTSG
jgi:hypothetical protein